MIRVGVAVGLLFSSGCVATLPDPVWTGDLNVFDSYGDDVKRQAEGCADRLMSARSSGRNRSYFRVFSTIVAGSTSAVTGYIAATYSDDDPDKAKRSAQIAAGTALLAVVAQAIPDSSEALDKHRDGSASWAKARRLAFSGGSKQDIFNALQDCRDYKGPREVESTKQGQPL